MDVTSVVAVSVLFSLHKISKFIMNLWIYELLIFTLCLWFDSRGWQCCARCFYFWCWLQLNFSSFWRLDSFRTCSVSRLYKTCPLFSFFSWYNLCPHCLTFHHFFGCLKLLTILSFTYSSYDLKLINAGNVISFSINLLHVWQIPSHDQHLWVWVVFRRCYPVNVLLV